MQTHRYAGKGTHKTFTKVVVNKKERVNCLHIKSIQNK